MPRRRGWGVHVASLIPAFGLTVFGSSFRTWPTRRAAPCRRTRRGAPSSPARTRRWGSRGQHRSHLPCTPRCSCTRVRRTSVCRAVRRRCTGRRFLTASVIATRERRAAVPVRRVLCAQPGYIYLLRRPSWENCTYRSDQKRARLEDGFAGGADPPPSSPSTWTFRRNVSHHLRTAGCPLLGRQVGTRSLRRTPRCATWRAIRRGASY